jgi:hypothetical protein
MKSGSDVEEGEELGLVGTQNVGGDFFGRT